MKRWSCLALPQRVHGPKTIVSLLWCHSTPRVCLGSCLHHLPTNQKHGRTADNQALSQFCCLTSHDLALDREPLVLSGSVQVWVRHRKENWQNESQRLQGSAAGVDRLEPRCTLISWFWFARSKSHCGLRAGLVVNVFPVIAFPLLSFGHSLCVSGLFFPSSHCRDMKRAMHKQNHVMRGFCRSGGADVSHHTTPRCSWTLYNRAMIRQLRTRRETDDGVCVAKLTCGS